MSDEFDDALDPALGHHCTRPIEAPSGRPSLPASRLISRLYGAANRPLRAQLLACLLRPLSPLGLVAIAAGAFGSFLHRSDGEALRVVIDDVTRFSSEQIAELARFVEQVNPQALQSFAGLILDNPVGLAAFSASAAVVLLRGLPHSADAQSMAVTEPHESTRRDDHAAR